MAITDAEARAALNAATRAQGIGAVAATDAMPQEAARAVNALSTLAADFPSDPAGFAAGLLLAWRMIALHGDADALRRLLPGEIDARLADLTGERVRAVEIVAMTAALALAAARGTDRAEQDASRARAELARIATPAISLAGSLGLDAFEWLSKLTGEAALTLSRASATRAPLVMIETGISLSAIRLAYDLYGDANRAGEIVARNRVSAPAFMPVEFEALSR